MQRADALLLQMSLARVRAYRRRGCAVGSRALEEKTMQLSCAVPLALFDRNGLMRAQADALTTQQMTIRSTLGDRT